MSKEYLPNIDTVADLIDRLIVEVNKLSWFEMEKRRLQMAGSTDSELIQRLDHASRNCCELRSRIKTRLNAALSDIVSSAEYSPTPEARTFAPPVSDAIDALCHDGAREILVGELKEKLKKAFYG